MGQETVGKKDKEKKKARNRQDKADKKKERQANNNKGKSLESMMAYVDDNGNIVDTPQDPSKKRTINIEDIQLGAAIPRIEDAREVIRKGVVTFFNEAKGYGFINDLKSQESVFVHINQLTEPIKERDKVVFETEMGQKGLSAVRVRKDK